MARGQFAEPGYATGWLGLAAEALETLIELLDASRRVHNALFASVERMRSARDFNVNHGVGSSIEFNAFLTRESRTGEKGFT